MTPTVCPAPMNALLIGAQSLQGNLAPVKMFWPENSHFPEPNYGEA